MPTTLGVAKKASKKAKGLAAKLARRRHAKTSALPSADDFLARLRGSGWWDTLTPEQKDIAGSLFPEASGMRRPQIRRGKLAK